MKTKMKRGHKLLVAFASGLAALLWWKNRGGRAGKILKVAEAVWRQRIVEPTSSSPNGAAQIDQMIRSGIGLDWSWEPRYVRNRQFEWCGAFAAFVYGHVGLKRVFRRGDSNQGIPGMASTYRLYQWARGNARWLEPSQIRPGDVAVVGKDPNASGNKRWGNHITICRAVKPDGIETYEGNAGGTGPDGETYEGVIRQFRPFTAARASTYRVIFGVRPLSEDWGE